MDLLTKTAFFLSVFLSIVLLDAGIPRRPTSPASAPLPTTHYKLSVQLRLPEEVEVDGPLVVRVAARTPRGFAAPVDLDVDGLSAMGQFESAQYLLIVHAPGLVRVARSVNLDADQTLTIDLQRAVTRTIEVTTMVDGQLSPLSSATVLLTKDSELPFGRKTDTTGRAQFSQVPAGELAVSVYAPGYQPYRATTEGDLLVRLRPVSALRVRVTREGHPVPEAKVWISGLSLWPARAVQTGPKGYIDITGLNSGSFVVSASQGDDVSSEERVELGQEEGITEVSLDLLPGQFLLAKITNPGGEPLAHAHVTHSAEGLGSRAHHAETDLYGMVRLGPLPAITGQLQVRARGYLPQITDASAELPQVIVLQPSGTVTGRVVDARGMPVEGASLEVVGTDINKMPVAKSQQLSAIEDAHFAWATANQNVLLPAGELGVLLGPVPAIPLGEASVELGESLASGDRGHFEIDDVPPGRLVVIARHPDHMDGRSQPFDLSPGGKKNVEIVLGTGLPLRGRVLDHAGFPVAFARIRVTAPGFERQITAEADGTFSLAAAPEDVRLRISRPGAPLGVLLEHAVGRKERSSEVLIELPKPRETSTVRIQDRSGDPIALVQMTITSREPSIPLRLTRFSDRNGEVRFDEVAGLPVLVETFAPGFVTLNRETRLGREETLHLDRATNAVGRITAVRGRRVAAGARVSLSIRGLTRRTIADDLGHYELADLPPGNGILSAEHPEFGKASERVKIAPPTHRPQELADLDLLPPATVRGRVVDAQGETVPGARLSLDRLSAYLPLSASEGEVGRADGSGRFEVSLDADKARYLFGADPGRAFGFSDRLSEAQLEGREDVTVLLDRTDEAGPDARATVLLSLEDHGGALVVYAVAPGSAAYRAGIRQEDRLVAVGDIEPSDVEEARESLSGTPGTDVLITYRRGATEKTVRVLREAFAR